MVPTKFQFIWPSGCRGEYFFLNQPIRNKNCLWWPCLLTDRDEMRNLYRGPAIYAPCKDSVHLATRFQRRNNRPIRNKNSLWWPFLLMDRDNEQYLEKTFHRCFLLSFISFGWGVSEEKIKMWKVNRRRTSSDDKSSHCLWQGQLKQY
jgi:hypothetical protein